MLREKLGKSSTYNALTMILQVHKTLLQVTGTTGSYNTAIGYDNTIGTHNTAIGNSYTTGIENTAIG